MKQSLGILRTAATAAALLVSFNLTQATAQRAATGGLSGMMRLGNNSVQFVDPSVTSTSVLVKRPDVFAELKLSQRQKEQLEDNQKKTQEDMSAKMAADRPDFAKMKDMTDDERKAKMTEFRDQMQQHRAGVAIDFDKKAEGILSASQLKRLHELDLQWRGPLALTDKTLGDKIELTTEQRTKMTALLTEYRGAEREKMDSVLSGFSRRGAKTTGTDSTAAAPAPDAPRPRLDPTEVMNKISAAQEEIEKAHADINKKALAVLTPEQLTKWKDLQGEKFTFRKTE